MHKKGIKKGLLVTSYDSTPNPFFLFWFRYKAFRLKSKLLMWCVSAPTDT